MGHDPGRAVVATLAILAVLFAASAFPSAGLGGFPGGIGEAPGGSPGPGPADGGERGGDPTTPATAAPERTETRGDRTPVEGGTTPAPDPTETATPTETPTETPANAGSGGGGGDLLWSVVVTLLLAMTVVVAVLGVGLGLGIAVGVVVPRRVGPGGRLVLVVAGRRIDVGGALSGVSQGSMRFVFGLSSSLSNLAVGLGSATTTALGALSTVGRGGGRALLSVPSGLGRGLAAAGTGLGSALASVPSGFGSLLSGIGRAETEDAPLEDARGRRVSPDDGHEGDGDDDRDPPESVEEAWDRFTDRLPVRNSRSRTPGEFARVAASRGVPAEAVGSLTRTFREVRYGERPNTDARVRRARAAWARIREYFRGEES